MSGEPVTGLPRVRRDWMDVDPVTGNPRCYGNEDPKSNTCLTCDYQIPCREMLKMGLGGHVVIIDDKAEDEELRAAMSSDDSDDEEAAVEEEPTE